MIRTDERRGRLQRIHVDVPTLRKEVKEQGRTFENMDEYLRKYYGFNNFVMTDIDRIGSDIVIGIRHIGWLERFKNWIRGQ